MYKTYKVLLIDSSFVIALLVVVAAFVTAKTYIQLAVAIVLYPLLAFFAYKVFTHSYWKRPAKNLQIAIQAKVKPVEKAANIEGKNIGIADIDKRTFLKLIGATGVTFFLISIFGRRIEALLFNRNLETVPNSVGAPVGKTGTPTASPTEGYTISEIDDNEVSYFGFINKDGGWFIMKGDTETGSFRYFKGKSNFPINWNNRENINYDYFHEVFSQN